MNKTNLSNNVYYRINEYITIIIKKNLRKKFVYHFLISLLQFCISDLL